MKKTEKEKETQEKWINANRQRLNAYKRKWQAENREKVMAYQRKYGGKNKEKIKAAATTWRRNHPEAMRLKELQRRAREKKCGGRLSLGLADKLFKLQRGKCPCCGLPLGADYHMDHKMPLALGGMNTDDNIQLLRALCNTQKQAKHPIDFMQSRGFLI